MNNDGFQQLGDIFQIKRLSKKPPAYAWQDFALKIITELHVPNFKRNSVFKICKELDKNFLESCLADTKELAKTGEQWKYFFKIIADKNKQPPKALKL